MFASLKTAFKETFSGYQPILFAFVVGGIIYAFMAYLPVRDVAGIVMADNSIGISEKIKFFGTTLKGPLPGGNLFTVLALIISFFLGINLALLAHYLQKRKEIYAASNVALSMGALLTGLLGIGCLSCGSLIASLIASFVGGGTLAAAISFNGIYFGITSLLLILVSIALLSKKITEPIICEPEYLTSEKRPVIVFDGVCNLCNRAVDFIVSHDKRNFFYFADRDGAVAKKLKAEAGLSPGITEKTMLFFKEGSYYSKSRAVLEIAKELGFPYSLLYPLVIIPYPIRDFLYDFVSKRRETLFEGPHTCRIMTPGLESKFL